jgi:hypothetical protein
MILQGGGHGDRGFQANRKMVTEQYRHMPIGLCSEAINKALVMT